MLKKVFAMSTTVVLAAGLLSGCGTKESSASYIEDTLYGYVPMSFYVLFVRSEFGDTFVAKAK
ncbi:phosphate/phosphite/phosphonate ABC transporter substrate-binding protein, partial [Bacillus cereus]|nr:phosphate/phosphite/phosphonate ABC transporter substrate-binding protein [Bacillus cereus]